MANLLVAFRRLHSRLLPLSHSMIVIIIINNNNNNNIKRTTIQSR